MLLVRWGGVSLALSLALLACTGEDLPRSSEPASPASPTDPAATPNADPKYFVFVQGVLVPKDREEQKKQHDALAKGGEESAKKAGDVGHDVFLGSGLLGSTPNDFLALDRWVDAANIEGFYSNPVFAEGFAKLITPKRAPEVFEKSTRLYSWGTLDEADGVSPHYWVFVRARFKEADPTKQQEGHDAAARGGEANARAAGDVAHVVFTGLKDPLDFLAIDVWTKPDGIAALYTDPDFQAALAPVFEQVEVIVGQSSDFHQW